MAIWKLGGLAIAAVIGSGLLIGQASAMPANGMATVAGKVGDGTQEVRWVGGWRGGLGWRGAGWRGGGLGLGWRGAGWRGGGWGMGWRGGWAGRWGWNRGLYAYGGPGWRSWVLRRRLWRLRRLAASALCVWRTGLGLQSLGLA